MPEPASLVNMPPVVAVASHLAFCFMFPAFVAYTAEAGVVTAAFWDRELVELPQSANLTVTCSVVGADRYDVIRVVHSYEAKTLLLADNDVIAPVFVSLGRYHVTYQYDDNTAMVAIDINGLRGEDTGILACQQLNNNDFIAYVDVIVYVPVRDVHVTSISSDGGQSTVASGGDVYLQQGTSLGVGCICTTVGSRNPPTVQVYVGDDDVTADFNVSTEVDSDTQTSGLSFYQVVVRLSYVTTLPDRRLHGQRLVCTASRPEFDDVSATALLLVRFAPVVTCNNNEYSADIGSNVTVTCTVSANPSSRVTWSAVVQSHDDFYSVLGDASVTITSTAVTEIESSVSLHVIGVARRHSRNYTLGANNELGSDSDVITLAAVAPPGDSSAQQNVVGGLQGNVVIVEVSRSETTSSSPSPTFTVSSTSTANVTPWRRSTTTHDSIPHSATNRSTSGLHASSIVIFVAVVVSGLRTACFRFRSSST